MSQPTIITIRARALAAVEEQERHSGAADEERLRRYRAEARERLIGRLLDVLGIGVRTEEIDTREDRNGQIETSIVIDGVRFRTDYNHLLEAVIERDGCDHVSSQTLDASGDPWASLGALIRLAADAAAKPCETCAYDEAENAPRSAGAPVAPPPSLDERLGALVREVVRDELWRREEA